MPYQALRIPSRFLHLSHNIWLRQIFWFDSYLDVKLGFIGQINSPILAMLKRTTTPSRRSFMPTRNSCSTYRRREEEKDRQSDFSPIYKYTALVLFMKFCASQNFVRLSKKIAPLHHLDWASTTLPVPTFTSYTFMSDAASALSIDRTCNAGRRRLTLCIYEWTRKWKTYTSNHGNHNNYKVI